MILNNKSIQETQKELLLMIFEWKVDMRGIYHKGNTNANNNIKTDVGKSSQNKSERKPS